MSMSWDDYMMGLACAAATKSKDPSSKVGCVIVGEDKETLSTGYNGILPDVEDLYERMAVRPEKYLWMGHAEETAIARAARVGARLKGAKIYVTHIPCCRCARMIIQAGIREVVTGGVPTRLPPEEQAIAETMFREAGITRAHT